MKKRLLPIRKQKFFILCLLIICCPAAFIVAQSRDKSLLPAAAAYSNKLNNAPLLFTENQGQVVNAKGNLCPDVLFTAHSNGAKVFLTATGINYQFEKTIFPDGYKQEARQVEDHQKQEKLCKQIKTETYRFTLSLQGANPTPKVHKEEQNAGTENFYLPQCPAGITNVHTYGRLVYENVYPGIDWIIYTPAVGAGKKTTGLKYDFRIHPGADPALIRLKVSDAQSVQIDKEGRLVMTTALGEVREAAPVSYCGGSEVATAFRQSVDGTIRFATNAYDKSKVLTIDPTITWSTFYGGNDYDYGYSCAVDSSGDVYLAGQTYSNSGIASGGFQNTYSGTFDGLLVKFSSSGSRIWATYYGSNGGTYGNYCIVDRSNNVYLAGSTSSTSSIASGGFQNTYGGGQSDGFLAKFSSGGSRIWATYYGGSGTDAGQSCAMDSSGNVYLAGFTESLTGIASGGFQNTFGGLYDDGFLVKFSSSGNRLWATYYGGNDSDFGRSCAVDNSGNVYLAGYTASTSGIASGGFQNTFGGGFNNDAFLVKFNSSGNRLWATYYGGMEPDVGNCCAVDGSGNVYLSGAARSDSVIASGGFQNTRGGEADAFLVKFSSSGSRIWATYYGGVTYDQSQACAVDSSGNVYIAGGTESASGIASGGFQNTYAGGSITQKGDAFLAKFSSSGSRLWGTYYGGVYFDRGYSCAVDRSGNVYIAGQTSGDYGIAYGGFQNVYGGGPSDAFLAKIDGNTLVGFTSVANGNWNDPSIWSGGVVPDASSAVIINSTITVTANASCYSLTVNPPRSLTVRSGVTLTVLH